MESPGRAAPADPGFVAWRTGLRWLRPRAWLVFLVVGLGLGFGGVLVGDAPALGPLIAVVGMSAAAAILAGVRVYRPARRLPWQLLATSMATATVGGLFITAPGSLGVVGQALTGVGALIGFVGVVVLIRGRIPGGDRTALLDAAILASGTGVLIWAFGLAPFVLAGRQSSVVPALFFYPGLVAMAMIVRMWFLPGAHRPATRLIVMFVLASNAIVMLDMLVALIEPGLFARLLLLTQFASLTFVGAAALHPSMAILPERQHVDLRPIGRSRIVALTAALLVNPTTLTIEIVSGHQVDPAPYLIGGVVIGLLVIARLGDALRQLGESLHERESLMELLRRQALYDNLTSLPNRSLFTERLVADFGRRSTERQLAVLLLDLDEFKAVNDSYGHQAGDDLLVAVGQRLRTVIRDGDTVARLGGDEFVIALPNLTDATVPGRVAQRVLATLGEPFEIGGHRLTVRASVGVAVASMDDRTTDDLVRNADIAMYLAKSRGDGRYEVFEPSMQVAAATQLKLRADLAVGIAGGDLRLHYQPVVDLRTGRTIGYEGLVRWLREGELVPPLAFIPVAESSGLIGPLTDWVIGEACRTVAAWGKGGADRPWVSVNISSSQLIRRDMTALLERTLATTGLSADRLVIEITESALLEIEVARPAIDALTRIGVRVAIDDFGIGYSALSYLARLPIDIVKIDRSFVVALQHAGPEEAIASAIIALARRLGLTTIGEGIETAAQLQQLVDLGCDLGQGFYLGRPVAAGDLPSAALPRDLPRRLTPVVAAAAPLAKRRAAARGTAGPGAAAYVSLTGDAERAPVSVIAD